MMTTKNRIDANEIAAKLNASGYEYYGTRARAWAGNGFCRIYFGSDFVTIESDGKVHANKSGKARAQTAGWSAVEAVEKIIIATNS